MLTSDVAVDQLLLDLATVTKTIAAAPCCRHVVLQGHKTQIEKNIKFNFFPLLIQGGQPRRDPACRGSVFRDHAARMAHARSKRAVPGGGMDEVL